MAMKEVEEFGRAFDGAITRFGTALEAANPAGAVTGAIDTFRRLIAFLRKLAAKIVSFLGRLFEALPTLPEFVAEQFGDLVTLIGDELTGVLDDLAEAAGAALDTAISAALAFFELIKKTIYLLTDFTRKTVGDNPLIDVIHMYLDLFNNLMGNLAELLSPKFGAKARRIRLDMYGQLAAIRTAQGAIAPDRQDEKGEAAD